MRTAETVRERMRAERDRRVSAGPTTPEQHPRRSHRTGAPNLAAELGASAAIAAGTGRGALPPDVPARDAPSEVLPGVPAPGVRPGAIGRPPRAGGFARSGARTGRR